MTRPADTIAHLEAQIDMLIIELKESRRQSNEWRVLYETVLHALDRHSAGLGGHKCEAICFQRYGQQGCGKGQVGP